MSRSSSGLAKTRRERSDIVYPEWCKQSWETDKMYARFKVFRDLDPLDRSPEMLTGELGWNVSAANSAIWRNQWHYRAQKYDEHREAKRQAAGKSRREEILEVREKLCLRLLHTMLEQAPRYVGGDNLIRDVVSLLSAMDGGMGNIINTNNEIRVVYDNNGQMGFDVIDAEEWRPVIAAPPTVELDDLDDTL